MKVATVVLAAAVLLIAGFGAGVSSHTSASPTPSSASTGAPFTVPTKFFRSPQLGIAFSYPASWRLQSDSSAFATYGFAALSVHSLKGAELEGALELTIQSERIHEKKPPLPYLSVGPSAVRDARKAEKAAMKGPRAAFRFETVGGLRLLSQDGNVVAPAPVWGSGQWRERYLDSRDATLPPFPTAVRIVVFAPKAQWEHAQAPLNAILASMRFSTPAGG